VSITLTDPTDQQLNEAVAVHVAGWRKFEDPDEGDVTWLDENGKLLYTGRADGFRFAYTQSADAVLPLLEKWRLEKTGVIHITTDAAGRNWQVNFGRYPAISNQGVRMATVIADTFPRAACLALLAAHGVTVTFR